MKKLLIGVTVLTTLAVPSIAQAEEVSSYFGNARTNDADRKIRVCDTARDGHSVYTQYYRGRTQSRLEVFSGAGTCKWSQWDYRRIRKFRVCRNVRYWPDKCTDWRGVLR